jgi:hypothetical protein
MLYPTAEIKWILAYTGEHPSSLSFETFTLPLGPGMQLPETPKSALDNWRELTRTTSFSPLSISQKVIDQLYSLDELALSPIRNIRFDSVFDKSALDSMLANSPYGGDTWQISEVKKTDFDSSSSKFLPKRGERTPNPKNIPSKRKKKGLRRAKWK